MTDLVVRVIGDVLREVIVNCFDRLLVGVIAVRQLAVLLPEVGLDQLRGGQEAHDIDVASGCATGTEGCPRPICPCQ